MTYAHQSIPSNFTIPEILHRQGISKPTPVLRRPQHLRTGGGCWKIRIDSSIDTNNEDDMPKTLCLLWQQAVAGPQRRSTPVPYTYWHTYDWTQYSMFIYHGFVTYLHWNGRLFTIFFHTLPRTPRTSKSQRRYSMDVAAWIKRSQVDTASHFS